MNPRYIVTDRYRQAPRENYKSERNTPNAIERIHFRVSPSQKLAVLSVEKPKVNATFLMSKGKDTTKGVLLLYVEYVKLLLFVLINPFLI